MKQMQTKYWNLFLNKAPLNINFHVPLDIGTYPQFLRRTGDHILKLRVSLVFEAYSKKKIKRLTGIEINEENTEFFQQFVKFIKETTSLNELHICLSSYEQFDDLIEAMKINRSLLSVKN